ncbi:hypothetical protein [Labrenzia sp. CE80]|uniref:hypothetical protein n=1 Tax=Labrenzia sp. CE80 TaxID=1788986 RepID=UPI00129B292F|nr:hypothetical protein [Labrenzia sp. CE80]
MSSLIALAGMIVALPMPQNAFAEEQATVTTELDVDPKADLAQQQRYALVPSDDDILRIDREAGSVSFCRKANDIWRCVPAPLAEEAYLAEIASLADEVDQLKARLRELEADGGGGDVSLGSGDTDSQNGATSPAITGEAPTASNADEDAGKDTPLSDEDEAQLEQMLNFSEKAMRRFFGLMKDLRDELDSPAEDN